MKLGLVALCVALVTVGNVFAQTLPSVALVEAQGSANSARVVDVQSKLQATGRFSTVDVFYAATSTPTVAQLQNYPAVLVWSDSPFADKVQLGNNLDTYAQAGGRVVVAVFAVTNPGSLSLGGAFTNDYPITPASQTAGTRLTLGTVLVPNNPLMQGVSSFDGGSATYRSSGGLAAGATEVADWSNGSPLVATKVVGASTVVALNFWPVSSDVTSGAGWDSTTDGATLMANALLNSAVPPTPVPTVSNWAVILLALIFSLAGVFALRARKAPITI